MPVARRRPAPLIRATLRCAAGPLRRRASLACFALTCAAATSVAAQLGAGATYRFGGVDIYGTDAIAVDAFSQRFGDRARALFDAVQTQDEAAIDTLVPALRADVRALADFAWVDMALVFDPGDTTAYMTFDVVERADSAARMSFAAAPAGQVEDPGGLLALWRAYEDSVLQRMMRGVSPTQPTPETCPALHCLAAFGVDPSLARYERAFVDLAPRHADALLRVLGEDADEDDRGAAAYLLAHIGRPDTAVAALVRAMRDPGGLVRNDATRVLLMAASTQPDLDVPLDAVIANIDAPTTTSRNKALYLLFALARRPELHDPITRAAGPTLLRLLRLMQPNNHQPAWEILKLISGESFGDRDYAAWERWLRGASRGTRRVRLYEIEMTGADAKLVVRVETHIAFTRDGRKRRVRPCRSARSTSFWPTSPACPGGPRCPSTAGPSNNSWPRSARPTAGGTSAKCASCPRSCTPKSASSRS